LLNIKVETIGFPMISWLCFFDYHTHCLYVLDY
jgi:hypothetical protein